MSNFPPSSDTSDSSTMSSSDFSSPETILTAGAHCTTAVTSSDSDSMSTSTGTSRLMSPGVRRPLMAGPHRAVLGSPPAPPVPPDDSAEADTDNMRRSEPIWGSREDIDLIQWDLEMSGQPGSRRFQPPTLPAPGPRPAGQQGQSAETGALGAGSRPGVPISSSTHQPQVPSAPPEPGEPLAAIMAAMEQLRQVNLHQQKELRAVREEMLKMKCSQSENYDIGLGPSDPEHEGF